MVRLYVQQIGGPLLVYPVHHDAVALEMTPGGSVKGVSLLTLQPLDRRLTGGSRNGASERVDGTVAGGMRSCSILNVGLMNTAQAMSTEVEY